MSGRPGGSNECDGIGVNIAARVDTVAGRKEDVESLNEGGVRMKEVCDALDDLGRVNTSEKRV